MRSVLPAVVVMAVVGASGAAPPGGVHAALAPVHACFAAWQGCGSGPHHPSSGITYAHQCFTAWRGQTYELDYTIAGDDPESAAAGRSVQGSLSVLDPGSMIYTFQGATGMGRRSKVADTPNGPLYKSTAIARVATDSFGAPGAATFRRLQRPFIPDIVRLTTSGRSIDFGCDLSQFMH